ncbi:MAG: polyribonucleotide nucleotidyltransferase [Helicobacteraceae bacterium]
MKEFKYSLQGKEEIYKFDYLAKQADGAAVIKEGKSVLLAAVSIDEENPAEEDFLPLTVNYIEKAYAAGRFPGGFFKRESKPSEFETLTSRIVDRTIRPLFPKGFNYPVVLTVMVFSVDENADLQRLALLAANAALAVSPLDLKNVCGVRIGKIDEKIVINPGLTDLERSSLDLFVAGSKDELLMIEMQAKKKENGGSMPDMAIDPSLVAITPELFSMGGECKLLNEDELSAAIGTAKDAISAACQAYEQDFASVSKPKKEYKLLTVEISTEILEHIRQNEQEAIKEALSKMAKTERGGFLKAIAQKVKEAKPEWEEADILLAVEKLKREIVRANIVNNGVRADGRAPTDIRPISIETNILPRAHGSCLFTRGQTQALAVATLGGDTDRQANEYLTQRQTSYDDFMLHYNFHSFCVNEARPPKAPGRRELGHGNLARRALEESLPDNYENSIRVVSEILESNGSSSMASVCGGSLALRAAGIPTKHLVAGVAMGLITDGDKEVVLSDITGLEDHDGDMDFKVAGTRDGITALQMDIKLGGISSELLARALLQAKQARLHILGLMEEAAAAIRVNKDVLPKTEIFTVSTDKIVDIIGQAGKTIKELIETFEVSIDLDREKGDVKVRGDDAGLVEAAVQKIKEIASGRGGFRKDRHGKRENTQSAYNAGEVMPAKIEKILEFGMLAKLPDDNVGMIHISKVSTGRISRLRDYFNEGDEVEIIFVSQDPKSKKIELDLKNKIER